MSRILLFYMYSKDYVKLYTTDNTFHYDRTIVYLFMSASNFTTVL